MNDKMIMVHVLRCAMEKAEEILHDKGTCNIRTTQDADGFVLCVYNGGISFIYGYTEVTGELNLSGTKLQKGTDEFNAWLDGENRGTYITGLNQFSNYLLANKGRSTMVDLAIECKNENGVKLISTSAVIQNKILDYLPAYITLHEDMGKEHLKGRLKVGWLIIADNVAMPFARLNELLVMNVDAMKSMNGEAKKSDELAPSYLDSDSVYL